MYLFKFSLAFLSIGGASYALFKAEQAPLWVKFVAILMAIAMMVAALTDLPRAVDGVVQASLKVRSLLISLAPTVQPSQAQTVPRPQTQSVRRPARGMLDEPGMLGDLDPNATGPVVVTP